MKKIFTLSLLTLVLGCSQPSRKVQELQTRIDSLETQIANSYKPGFGEFMSSIQVHHNKLWFAGQNQNWKLADFEIHEIMETIDDIKRYETERKESRMIDMILPAIDSVNLAIQLKNASRFDNSFNLLTNTCNDCHKASEFEFNVVKIPDHPPFSNQDFTGK